MVFGFGILMSFSSPESNSAYFFWPFILRGLGIGFMLSPVMSLSLNGLKGSDLSQGAGVSNMIRQLGGAVGIAVMNVFLEHRNAINDTYLSKYLNTYNEAFQERITLLTQNFMSNGYFKEDAQQMAYKVLDLTRFKQQSLVIYDNIFWTVAVIVLLCIPIVLLIRTPKTPTKPVDVHLD